MSGFLKLKALDLGERILNGLNEAVKQKRLFNPIKLSLQTFLDFQRVAVAEKSLIHIDPQIARRFRDLYDSVKVSLLKASHYVIG